MLPGIVCASPRRLSQKQSYYEEPCEQRVEAVSSNETEKRTRVASELTADTSDGNGRGGIVYFPASPSSRRGDGYLSQSDVEASRPAQGR